MSDQTFIENTLELARKNGFEQAECYLVAGRSLEVRIQDKSIAHFENSRNQGVSFRGLKDGKMGYAYSERIDPDVLPFLFNEASENARILSDQEVEDLFGGEPLVTADTYSQDLSRVLSQQVIDTARKIEMGGLETDGRIRGMEYALAEYSEGERLIANTLGLNVRQKSNLYLTFAMARAQQDESIKQGTMLWQGRDISRLDAISQGKEAAKIALDHLGASQVASGQYDILLENRAAVDLLRTFVPVFYADRIQKGFSLLGDKMGKQIASKPLSIIDDPFLGSSLYQPIFDSEGVSCKKTSLVDQGQLCGFLHNRKTASRELVQSTGNGFKPSFKSPVEVSSTNTYIKPDSSDRRSLLKQLDNGLMITSLAGLHAGTNLTSGDFSLSCEGFVVEGGQITRPVEQITIAGNFYQLLQSIAGIGDDLWFGLPGGNGQVGAPSLLVDALAVSGQSV